MYGARGLNGEVVFSTTKGILFDNMAKVGDSPLLSSDEAHYYTMEYMRNGMKGNLNWYRNQKQNYDDELKLGKSSIDIPALFIAASNDAALPPWMSANMEKSIPQLTRKEVEASHWALWEKPAEVNGFIRDWLEAKYFKPLKGSL
jgi:soluble epoxide hydrolase/lipid-phosphate phosphatase